MRRIRRLAARAEKRGLVKTVGSWVLRVRFSPAALLLPAADYRTVRDMTGKGYLRQGLERLWLLHAFRFEPEAYYWFGLFEPERFARAGEFITHRQSVNIFDFLNVGLRLDTIQDKMAFARLCDELDIPAPVTLGVWTPRDEPEPPFMAAMREMAAAEGLILKPQEG